MDYSEKALPLRGQAQEPALNVLALETSTAACSVAVLAAHGVFEQHRLAPRQHTELVFAMIDGVLGEAGLAREAIDVVAFGRGPGAFTGVRIAAAVAQGIAAARALAVAPVSSLAALAAGAARLYDARHVAVALDARRSEIYAGAWRFAHRADTGTAVVDECVIAPERLMLPQRADWLAVGNGWPAYRERFSAALAQLPQAELLYPHAQDVARLGLALHAAGMTVDAAAAQPVYLRGALD